MNITGIVLHARPARMTEVRASLAGLPGVEIHGENESGRFVLTVEDTPIIGAAERITHLHNIDGVIAVAMVYQHSEPEAGPEENAR